MLFFRKKKQPVTGISYKTASLSETGPSREANEDNILILYPEPGGNALFAMVADGMGGHNAGEVASRIACDTAADFIRLQYRSKNVLAVLQKLMIKMNKAIHQAAKKNTDHAGMGTTAVALFIREGQLHFANLGDSRLYCYRNHQLVQLSHDQTLVNNMVEQGQLTASEAEHHEMKNVLLQALGTGEKITPELSATPYPLLGGDRFLLCSDGIYDVFTNEELAAILAIEQPDKVIEHIRTVCFQRRAADNFSAILIEIVSKDNFITREQPVFYELPSN